MRKGVQLGGNADAGDVVAGRNPHVKIETFI
jgi:hypothetical protein